MKVQSYLSFEGRCDEAIAFYKKALGAEVVQLMRYSEAPAGAPSENAEAGCAGGTPDANKVMHAVFRIGAYSYGEAAPESLLLGLLKGGLRVATGLIGKRNPAAVSFSTPTATIGIRGTEFDARLCEDDCAAEERPGPRAEVARVVELGGHAAGLRLPISPVATRRPPLSSPRSRLSGAASP